MNPILMFPHNGWIISEGALLCLYICVSNRFMSLTTIYYTKLEYVKFSWIHNCNENNIMVLQKWFHPIAMAMHLSGIAVARCTILFIFPLHGIQILKEKYIPNYNFQNVIRQGWSFFSLFYLDERNLRNKRNCKNWSKLFKRSQLDFSPISPKR